MQTTFRITVAAMPVIVAACAGSPARIAYESADQIRAEQTAKLCTAYGPDGGVWAKSSNVLAELERRGAIRPDFAAAIQDSKVALGMNACEVVAAWANPADINRTINASGATEQWVYLNGNGIPKNFVYLTNGIVTAIQD